MAPISSLFYSNTTLSIDGLIVVEGHRLNLTAFFVCVFVFVLLCFALFCFYVFFAVVFSLEYTHQVRGAILFDAKTNTLLEFLCA
jgi:hypothetical protein